MKRILLIGFILAILILVMPQGVSAGPVGPGVGKEVIVEAEYGAATVFDAYLTDGVSVWNLKPDDPNLWPDQITFKLLTQSKWTVTATSTNNGYMWGDQGPMKSAFNVESADAADWVVPYGGEVIKSGDANYQNQDWQADIKQPVAANELGSDNPYEITLTFTCAADF
jgi:hypothetical protein